MSNKRQATNDLNHDNWDQDEVPEKQGTYLTASEDEMKNRVIKKGRRQVAGSKDAADGSKSLFSGFSGFGKSAIPVGEKTATTPFAFLSKIPATSTTKATFSFGSGVESSTAQTLTQEKPGHPAFSDVKEADDEKEANLGKYYAKLKALNQSVSWWIKTHVDKNPLCLLTQIFKEYENYLKDIEKEKSPGSSTGALTVLPEPAASNSTASTSNAMSSFKFTETSTSNTTTPPFPAFSLTSIATSSGQPTKNIFGGNATNSNITSEKTKSNGISKDQILDANDTVASTSKFSFGKPGVAAAPPTGFSFNTGSTPFTFKMTQSSAEPATSASTAADEGDEELPPKVEFKQVVEDGAIYSKKCKVFVKKDNNFADRGVGTLYLKPVKDTEKTQLLVRADTNLGNILVNILLSAAIPSKRMGKNNVMLVCLPTPDEDKPTSLLLRVKTSEEADELLDNIEKYKK